MSEEQSPTIYELLQTGAKQHPEATAILSPGRSSLNYRQLLSQVDYAIESLKVSGITRGERIVIVLPPGPELATAFLAVSSAATAIPLNPAYVEHELDFYVADLAPKAVIVTSETGSLVNPVAKRYDIDVIELHPRLDAQAGMFSLTTPQRRSTGSGHEVGNNDIALVLYTSGTTSKPKRVPLTHTNLLSSAENIAASLRLTAADRCLNIMPLFHIHGLIAGLLSSLSAMASVAIPPAFSSSSFFGWLEEVQATWYTAVPAMHQAVVRAAMTRPDQRRSHSLRFIRSSSAPLPPALMGEIEAIFQVPVIEAYGMTEASHQIASNPLPPLERKAGSVGVPTRTEVAIVDEDGHPIAPGDTGEIVLRGANVTEGYENNSEANDTAFTNGWFRTGDQGYFDSDGYLFLTGRIKELINRGGTKLSPFEIEAALQDHPALSEAVVFPVFHSTLGENVAAAVVRKPEFSVTTGELQQFAALRLADFKVPRHIEFVDHIPRSATGKVQRRLLASQFGLDAVPVREGTARHVRGDARTDTEATLASIWRDVLRLDQISIHDSFFSLGGDSLSAVEVTLKVQELFKVDLPAMSVVETPTVAEMAERIASLASGQDETNAKPFFSFLVALQRGMAGKPIFVFPGGGGQDSEFFYFMRLLRHMRSDCRCYGFRVRGADGFSEPHASVGAMVRDYIAEMQTLQPEGPYFLVGDCIGGAAAYEAAQQLRAKGEAIAVLILLDSHSPTTRKYVEYRLGRWKEEVRESASRLWTALAGTFSPSKPTSQNTVNPAVHIRKVGDAYTRNVRRYRPKPYDGEIKLVVNAKWYQVNPTLGWGALASGRVESYAAAGDHFSYIDKGPHAEAVARQLTKWIDEAREAVEHDERHDRDSEPAMSTDFPVFVLERLARTKKDLADMIPLGDSFILVDGCEWGSTFIDGRRAIPFLERDGQYNGCPADDETAIRELERLRHGGANFIVFGWPAFWWLNHYADFREFLERTFSRIHSNDRIVAFDLRRTVRFQ
jgi:oxalate---CoA ligase